MIESKLLSQEALGVALGTARTPGGEHLRRAAITSIEDHIAALEAELAAEREERQRLAECAAVTECMSARRERDEARADNAALLSAVNDVLNYVHMQSCDMGGNHRHTLTRSHGPAVAMLQHVAAQPHPGVALLEEHRKALVRARNEGMERVATACIQRRDAIRSGRLQGTRRGGLEEAASIARAMKESEE